MNMIYEQIYVIGPLLVTIVIVTFIIYGVYWLLLKRKPELGSSQKLPRQLVIMGFGLAGILSIIIALPVSDTIRNQIIALLGIIVSSVIAFSSTTIISNTMAALMLRFTKPFKIGDFIRIDEYFGRVVEKGLLDTELQTESRELVSLPNLYLISKPVTVIHQSGAIVSVTLSLGYDVHHNVVQEVLIQSAKNANLDDPFIQIIELGNFSITYRVSGLLKDVKSILTTRSHLFKETLDTLHNQGIEIVSPTFMNQRQIEEDKKVIPKVGKETTDNHEVEVEKIVFDKAELAENREIAKKQLSDEIQQLEQQLKVVSDENKKKIENSISSIRTKLEELENQGKDEATT